MADGTPKKLKKKRRSKAPKMSPNLASKFAALQADSKPVTKAYQLDNVGRLKKNGLEETFQEKEYQPQLNEVSNITNDQIKKATTYKTLDKKHNKVNRLKKRKSVGPDAQSEPAAVTTLRREKEQEHIMRMKATENLEECQKKLQRAVAAQENRDYIIEQLKRQNAALRKQIKKLQLKAPMNKKQKQRVKENIDKKSEKILTSKKQQELFEGALSCEERNNYEERWAKLTNIGELVIFENEAASEALYAVDLVEEYKELREPEDSNLKFDLISSLTSNRYKFKGVSHDYIAEWIKSIKVVQYYWDVMTEEVDEDEEEEEEDDDDSENKKEEEMIVEKVEKKITETDPFWIDVIEKMDDVGYEYIKQQIPPKEELNDEDLTFNKWKKVLWRKDYVNEFELSCSVQLIRHDTGKWDEDENNILFASVSKYGTASYAAWDQIADNLNRPVNEVMKKYSKLVGVSVKKLKKMAVARG